MLDYSCEKFIDELGTKAPVPGGGSASALVAAIGMALGTMVGELTTGKKKYQEYEAEISNLIYRSKELTEELKTAVARDVEAFEPLSRAYTLPSVTEEDKRAKNRAVQACLVDAAAAPMELAELCVKALRILDSYSLIGSRLAISDVGVGTALCEAALKGARLNVLINLRLMDDEEKRLELLKKIDSLTDTGMHLAEMTYARVEKELK